MCGIVGAGHWADAPAFETAANLQMHHGPDDGGVWEYCAADGIHVGLGSRRWIILDLSPAGHRPTANEQKTL